MLLVSHTIRILTGDYHLFYKYKNTRNDNRAKKKMFRNQQKSYIYKDNKTRSHTDNFGENNVKCLIAKGICRFVPHSSAGGF